MSLSVYFLQVIIGFFLVGAMDELDGNKDGYISFGGKSSEGWFANILERFALKKEPKGATAEKKEADPIGFQHLKPNELKPKEMTPKRQGISLNEDSYRAEIKEQLKEALRDILGDIGRSDVGENVRNFLNPNFEKEDAEEGRKTQQNRSQKLKDAAQQLRDEGHSISEIAMLLKRSERTIGRYLSNK